MILLYTSMVLCRTVIGAAEHNTGAVATAAVSGKVCLSCRDWLLLWVTAPRQGFFT